MSEEEKLYSVREIDAMFLKVKEHSTEAFNDVQKTLERIEKSFGDQLTRIETQTNKTNGRVTALELWKSAQKATSKTAIGFLIVIIIPLGIYAFNLSLQCRGADCVGSNNTTTNINQ